MISLNKVYKSFDSLTVLEDFDISFKENKITCLFGPSGVGKTTIANIVSGLISLDRGTITGNHDTVFSYVFQEPRLLPWYSVYDNIDFVLKDILPKEQRHIIINKYLEEVGLSDFKDYMPESLSGGMAQRVSLARAFCYPSNFLIMDEPFKGLDIKLKESITQLFFNLWKEEKRTVLFITHDTNDAIQISDYIYIIKNNPATIIKKIDMDEYKNKQEAKEILYKY